MYLKYSYRHNTYLFQGARRRIRDGPGHGAAAGFAKDGWRPLLPPGSTTTYSVAPVAVPPRPLERLGHRQRPAGRPAAVDDLEPGPGADDLRASSSTTGWHVPAPASASPRQDASMVTHPGVYCLRRCEAPTAPRAARRPRRPRGPPQDADGPVDVEPLAAPGRRGRVRVDADARPVEPRHGRCQRRLGHRRQRRRLGQRPARAIRAACLTPVGIPRRRPRNGLSTTENCMRGEKRSSRVGAAVRVKAR